MVSMKARPLCLTGAACAAATASVKLEAGGEQSALVGEAVGDERGVYFGVPGHAAHGGATQPCWAKEERAAATMRAESTGGERGPREDRRFLFGFVTATALYGE
jgi:hypothetical protein